MSHFDNTGNQPPARIAPGNHQPIGIVSQRYFVAGIFAALLLVAFWVFAALRLTEGEQSIVGVKTSVVILRPPAEVFAFVSNAENDVRWRSEVISMKNETPEPSGTGTRTVEVARVLGKQLETTTEIVEFVPAVRMSRRTVSGPTPVSTVREVVAVEGGTRFTYELRADVSAVFVFRLLRPAVQWWTQRKIEGYMATLKQLMEASTTVPTPIP